MVYIGNEMFFDEKSDFEEEYEEDFQYENEYTSDGDYNGMKKDNLEDDAIAIDHQIQSNKNEEKEAPNQLETISQSRSQEKYEENFQNKINNFQNKKEPKIKKEAMNNAISAFHQLLRWNDLSECGKAKIEMFLNSEIYCCLNCRELEQFLPCSRTKINEMRRNNNNGQITDNLPKSKKGRNAKLTPAQIEEFFAAAMEKRKKFEAVSLNWAEDFIFKRFSTTVSLPTIHRLFEKYGWKSRKVQKRHPRSESKNKAYLIHKFRQYIYGYIQKHKLTPSRVHIMDETGIYSNATVPTTYTYPGDKEAYVLMNESSTKDTFIATLTADGNGFGYYLPFKKEKWHKENNRKITDEKAVKGVGSKEMLEWCQKFIEYAHQGDLLIMDNLAAHHNKDCLETLKKAEIKVCFIPVRCADVLSVLDNAFFAVFKRKLAKLIFNSDEEKKDLIFETFESMKSDIGLAMFKHCQYYRMFEENYLKIDETLEYETFDAFCISEKPPDFKILKENNDASGFNSCLSLFLNNKDLIEDLMKTSLTSVKVNKTYFKILKKSISKILKSKRELKTNRMSYDLNFNVFSTIFDIFIKIIDMFPESIRQKHICIQIQNENEVTIIKYFEIFGFNGNLIKEIEENLCFEKIIHIPKTFYIYSHRNSYNGSFDQLLIHFVLNNQNYALTAFIHQKNYKYYFCFYRHQTNHWYEVCDQSVFIIQNEIGDYISSLERFPIILSYTLEEFMNE